MQIHARVRPNEPAHSRGWLQLHAQEPNLPVTLRE
jgi:hypothetical protein